ncbi:MAG: glycosyltransferase family 4 protein [Nitrospirae bacterium]|nr:glycosyltransferase family 4 protein [Nitrospirota bacterium]
MKPLNILHTESSLGWGGQEIRIINESLGMLRRGHKVYIAAPEESNIFSRANNAGIAVFPLLLKKKNLLDFLKIAALIKGKRIDIINTHSSSDSWVATIAARISRLKPLILRTRHLSTPIAKNPLSRLLYNTLPDVVITTGEEIRQRMIDDNKFDSSKIFSIPTGVDTEVFNPAKVKPAFYLKNLPIPSDNSPLPPFTKGGQGGIKDGFLIGMVSVLRSWKGHRYLIEAAPYILKKIPDAFFYIAGDGPQLQNIKKMITEFSLENKIFMLGHRNDTPQIFASFDVIVHPSYANEGVPQSILQAMAMEKPVIASDAGAIKEIVINRETGFLIEPKNPYQIAEKTIELYENPKLGIEFGKKGRRLVERKYSFENMLDKIESLYENLFKAKT